MRETLHKRVHHAPPLTEPPNLGKHSVVLRGRVVVRVQLGSREGLLATQPRVVEPRLASVVGSSSEAHPRDTLESQGGVELELLRVLRTLTKPVLVFVWNGEVRCGYSLRSTQQSQQPGKCTAESTTTHLACVVCYYVSPTCALLGFAPTAEQRKVHFTPQVYTLHTQSALDR